MMIKWKKKRIKDHVFNIEEVTLKKRRMTKKIKRCLDIFTFDIEVTSAFIDPERGIIAYEPGKSAEYWNDLPKLALPYIWQFSINDTVYYGREFKDFKKVLDVLPDAELIIYIHNLPYEFMFLQNILTFDDVFARAPHKPMKARCKEYPTIEFRCSYALTNMSLDAWGQELGVYKKSGQLDYNQLRTPKSKLTALEMEYCEFDCRVLYAGIKSHVKEYGNIWNIPMTATGKVRIPVKKIVTNDKDYMNLMHKLVPADADEYKLLKDRIFAGGYTHASRKYNDKIIEGVTIKHVDISSSYPFSLTAYKYPSGRWSYWGNRLPDPATFDYRAYMIKLHFIGIRTVSWNSYIQASKCIGHNIIYDNGRILAADELRITVTEQDYITICNNYEWESIESEGTYVCHKQYLPGIFTDFILDLYQGKTELKGVTEDQDPTAPEKYLRYKRWINSCFGMAVTALCQVDVEFDQESPEQWHIGNLTAEKVTEKLMKLKRWFDKNYFLSYSWGCWCTAYSRRRLWSCFEMVQNGHIMDNDLLYADTDSLFYIDDPDNPYSFDWFNDDADRRLKDMCAARDLDYEKTRPKDIKGKRHPLGHMEFESDCIAFRSLGSKKYLEKRPDNKLYMTVAGVNKGAVNCLTSMEDFHDGFEFDKDDPNMKKLEHTYIVDMPEVTYPDGYHSDFRFGINMRPTGYTLSKPDIMRDFFEFMEGHIAISQNYEIKLRGVF